MSEDSNSIFSWSSFKSFVVDRVVDNTIGRFDTTKHSLYKPEYQRLKVKYPDTGNELISKQAADNVNTILLQKELQMIQL
jgi:hypothetical protein